MNSAGRGAQHYFPASLIGQFSFNPEGKRRSRPVHVARRGVPKVITAKAEQAGLLRDHPRLYDDPANPSVDLDRVWQNAEGLIDRLDASVRLPEHKVLPIGEFIRVWVPYVAHVLARTPNITDDTCPDLRRAAPTSGAWSDRQALFGRFADTLAGGCQWTVVESTSQPFLTSDAGFVFLPSDRGGALVIPVTPTHAFLIEREPRSQSREKMRIPHATWSERDVAFLNDVLCLSAGREVYTSLHDQAERAMALWNDSTCPADLGGGTHAGLLRSVAAVPARTVFACDSSEEPWTWYSMIASRTLLNWADDEIFGRHIADVSPDVLTRFEKQARQKIAREVDFGVGVVSAGPIRVITVSVRGFDVLAVPTDAVVGTYRRVGPPMTTSG